MLIRLLHAYMMINYVVKYHFEISSHCWENCKKNLMGILFCRTL